MKVQILSDLHTELQGVSLPRVKADLTILAGDIGRGVESIKFANATFSDRPVLLVPGNHEFYRGCYQEVLAEMKCAAKGTNVAVLENQSVCFKGVRFSGATLWTNFGLFPRVEDRFVEFECQTRLRDFRLISWRDADGITPFRAAHARVLHAASMSFFAQEAAKRKREPWVVITHHAPSVQALMPRFRGDLTSAAFASDLGTFVRSCGASHWIHGHVHTPQVYFEGDVPVRSNPHGYIRSGEQERFNPEEIITINEND